MSQSIILDRWLRWNVRGEGKDRSPCGAERYCYTGFALYSYSWPVARLAKGKGKDWVCLTKSGVAPENPPIWKTDGGPVVRHYITVPDLAIFSGLEGDWLQDDEMHERMHWLFGATAQSFIERAQTWPAHKLLVGGRSPGSALLVSLLGAHQALYISYRAAFGLKWRSFPEHYMKTLKETIDIRRRKYHSETELAKRDRKHAREEAKKALGLEKKK